MKNCAGCYYSYKDRCDDYICKINEELISHPYFMGGPKRCECYTPFTWKKTFNYPSKKDLREKEGRGWSKE